jgi:hypothetical protein
MTDKDKPTRIRISAILSIGKTTKCLNLQADRLSEVSYVLFNPSFVYDAWVRVRIGD